MSELTIEAVREAIERFLKVPRKVRRMTKRRRKIAARRRAAAHILKSLQPLVGRINSAKLWGDVLDVNVTLMPPVQYIELKTVLVRNERTLTAEAQADRDDFVSHYGRDGNCSCHLSAPCGSCMHPGNPMQQDECEECWEKPT
jgi:hypothetical protein